MNPPRKNNFDFLRLVLALLVVRCHAGLVGWSLPWTEDEYFLGGRWAVQCFFVISGYLIFRSWDYQPNLGRYVEKRARRILPAYVFVLVVCTFGLSVLSELPYREYFADPRVYGYLFSNLAFVGFLQNTLPGVFADHPSSYVNGPLWTIKIEVMFYVSVPIIEYVARRMNRATLFAAIYGLAIVWNAGLDHLAETLQKGSLIKVSEQLPGQMSFFIAGASLHYFRDTLAGWFRPALVVSAAILVGYFATQSVWFYSLYPAALAILVIGFANHFVYLGNFGRYGDFSYGLYIYHYPILQIMATVGMPVSPPIVFAIGFAISLIASIVSWRLIESRWLLPSSHYLRANDVKANEPTAGK